MGYEYLVKQNQPDNKKSAGSKNPLLQLYCVQIYAVSALDLPYSFLDITHLICRHLHEIRVPSQNHPSNELARKLLLALRQKLDHLAKSLVS